MINVVFPILSLIDGWCAGSIPGFARMCMWGAVSGAATLAIYTIMSDQPGIGQLKLEARELRCRMLDSALTKSELLGLAWRNLATSLCLLVKTGVPGILSALPAVVMFCWLSAYQTHTLNPDDTPVDVEVLPNDQGVTLLPTEAFVRNTQRIGLITGEKCARVQFFWDGRLAYSGTPNCPPTGRVLKKAWWNALIGNEVGYIESTSPLDEIRFRFPRKAFLHRVPMWASTWELPFFGCLAVVALAIKIACRIK